MGKLFIGSVHLVPTGAYMVVHKELRCPSCGALSTIDHSSCPTCGGRLAPDRDAVDVDDILTDVSRLMDELAAEPSGEPSGRGGTHPAAAGPPPPLVLAGPSVKKDGVVAKESYQCLICGATIPADAGHCRICGTIFVDESEVHSFRGIPVTKISRSSEIDPEENELGQARRAETVRIEPPVPARGGRPQRPVVASAPVAEAVPGGRPARADELPDMEFEGARRPLVKKKIIRKKE
jgi:RNA polymerase subunit RPABC4/transcription elongation factor Spt4